MELYQLKLAKIKPNYYVATVFNPWICIVSLELYTIVWFEI